MTNIKMSSDESDYICFIDNCCEGRNHKVGQCPQTTRIPEKGELESNRNEVYLLTGLTPYRWAKPAHRCALAAHHQLSVSQNGERHRQVQVFRPCKRFQDGVSVLKTVQY